MQTALRENTAALSTSYLVQVLDMVTSPLFIMTKQTTVGTGALRELGPSDSLEVLPDLLAYSSI